MINYYMQSEPTDGGDFDFDEISDCEFCEGENEEGCPVCEGEVKTVICRECKSEGVLSTRLPSGKFKHTDCPWCDGWGYHEASRPKNAVWNAKEGRYR